jgi:hypothetical protein
VAQQYRKRMMDRQFDGFCRPECLSRW